MISRAARRVRRRRGRAPSERRDSAASKTAPPRSPATAAPIRLRRAMSLVAEPMLYRRAATPSRRRSVSTRRGGDVFPRRVSRRPAPTSAHPRAAALLSGDADHTDGTRREASLRSRSGCAVRRLAASSTLDHARARRGRRHRALTGITSASCLRHPTRTENV